MVAPTFANVSSEKSFTLADLSVTGYDAPEFDEEWFGGCYEGDFILKALNNDGSTAAAYYWIDYLEGDDEESPDGMEAGWYTKDGKNYTKLTSEETKAVMFGQGQGFWTLASGYQLVTAGQVTKLDIEFKTNTRNHTALGNCSPVDLELGNLSVVGYDAPEFDEEWFGGCYEGDFIIKLLNNDGSTAAAYYWIDYLEGDDEESPEGMEAGWYTKEGKEYIKLTAEELKSTKIPAGTGFWTLGSGYSLVIPSPVE